MDKKQHGTGKVSMHNLHGNIRHKYHADSVKRIPTGVDLAKRLELDTPPNRLLTTALTHPSYLFENPQSGLDNNQRLEFLGDAILDFVVAEYLYLSYPERPEGELTKMRAAVVNESTLARTAKKIQLGKELLLGKGEQVSGGRERPSILADAWEAVVGAIYLQYGFQEARRVILTQLKDEITEVAQGNYGDYKTMLQEKAQREETEVSYRILAEEGPDHNKRFTAGVYLQGSLRGKGSGRTKKEAEQRAAQQVLDEMGGENNG
ncbi:ribonuclease III [Desulfitobacterium dichloroeliminans LMG P-21439]|uniref:Ribonuclease 3 n=1 Tax=Desulfitobacterium dichloroeliminans (strain LMG P-21439 / DCA1) TaxID=871963 RepID=L0F8F5_DESDL|nr:ribonuclease III [Desulfitobacterium dichloroeliminans]AGA70089.1 ribonuclease III [Desulfitobacterium dichloroeliminans LMG P-21439]